LWYLFSDGKRRGEIVIALLAILALFFLALAALAWIVDRPDGATTRRPAADPRRAFLHRRRLARAGGRLLQPEVRPLIPEPDGPVYLALFIFLCAAVVYLIGTGFSE
jgi:hypothetical protein